MRFRFRLTRPLGAPAEAELAARAEDWLSGRADLLIAGMGGQVPVVVQLSVLAHADLEQLAGLGRHSRLGSVRRAWGTEMARLAGDLAGLDETYLKAAGTWTYLYRAVDQHGQVIDVLLSARRDLAAAGRFCTQAMRAGPVPVEVTTDRAPVYPRVLDELITSAPHIVEQYANNPIEADHGRLKARLRPMRGLKRHRSGRILAAGHAFVQNLRRGHYDIATEVPSRQRLRVAFDDLALAI